MDLLKQIEGILVWKGEPIAIKKLASWTNATPEEIKICLEQLNQKYQDSGLVVITNETEASIAARPELSLLIQGIIKEELHRDLGKAGLETLSIILYMGPIKRSEIDFVRGVNSQFILRNLLIRGLVNREQDPNDSRSFIYKPTVELLSYLGVSNVKELPDYESVTAEIKKALEGEKEGDTNSILADE